MKNESEIPTMTNQNILEQPPARDMKTPPDELAGDITALPLTLPDFANDIRPWLMNPQLYPRWIFTDRRRYQQARAQGYRNCTKHDLKPQFAALTPYEEDSGSKYVNGDLILMLIDRKRYLGALRHKHEMAERLAKPAMQRKLSVDRANADMGPLANALNRQRAAEGQRPLIEAFDDYAEKHPHTEKVDYDFDVAKEVERLGHEGAVDVGKGKEKR